MERSRRKGKQLASSNVESAEASTSLFEYPRPLATYEDVVRNAGVFMETLVNLHAQLRIRFKIPIISGREVDLHRLFVEATSRGGIEKLIEERRFNEVISLFDFSASSNVSFQLRKHYTTHLFHYERIYYFRATHFSSEVPAAPPVSLVEAHPPSVHQSVPDSTAPAEAHPASVHQSIPVQGSTVPVPPAEAHLPTVGQTIPFQVSAAAISPAETHLPTVHQARVNTAPGSSSVAVVDSTFHNGFIFTYMAGGHIIKYVAFNCPQALIPQAPELVPSSVTENPTTSDAPAAENPSTSTAPVAVRRRRGRPKVVKNPSTSTAPVAVQRRRGRPKAETRRMRDPSHPKQNRCGYTFFFQDQHAIVRHSNPGINTTGTSRRIGELWRKLSRAEKTVYQERAREDKQRYQAEMRQYRSQTGIVIGEQEPVPIQQRYCSESSENESHPESSPSSASSDYYKGV